MTSKIRLRRPQVAALGLIGCVAASQAAGTYTDAQLELAGRIGTAVALSRICNGTVPTTAVVKALAAGGLTEGDVLGDTPVRARMQRDAAAVIEASRTKATGGTAPTEIVRAACDSYRASFGPDGVLTPQAD
jgi:hypothetical protein